MIFILILNLGIAKCQNLSIKDFSWSTASLLNCNQWVGTMTLMLPEYSHIGTQNILIKKEEREGGQAILLLPSKREGWVTFRFRDVSPKHSKGTQSWCLDSWWLRCHRGRTWVTERKGRKVESCWQNRKYVNGQKRISWKKMFREGGRCQHGGGWAEQGVGKIENYTSTL